MMHRRLRLLSKQSFPVFKLHFIMFARGGEAMHFYPFAGVFQSGDTSPCLKHCQLFLQRIKLLRIHTMQGTTLSVWFQMHKIEGISLKAPKGQTLLLDFDIVTKRNYNGIFSPLLSLSSFGN